MAEIKTKVNDASVEDFLKNVSDETRRKDGFELLKLFTRVTGEEAKMWGTRIVGFGKYHYKSEKSSQEGDWMMTGFSVGKTNLTIYIISGYEDNQDLLQKLGKHKTSVSCLYINKLADIDLKVLEEIVDRSFKTMKKKYQ